MTQSSGWRPARIGANQLPCGLVLRIGEQSGQIEGMLSKSADYFEKEVDNQVKNISTIIGIYNPSMIIVFTDS